MTPCRSERIPFVLDFSAVSAVPCRTWRTLEMSDKLQAAIDVLAEQLETQLQEVSETKKMINSLRRRMGQDPLYSDVSVESVGGAASRPDLYYGKPLATAAQMYLEGRKRACEAEEILQGLKAGGFDFDALQWKEKDRLRSLSMSLAKNTKTFQRLPNGSFGLLSWYDANSIRRRGEKADDDAENSSVETPDAPAKSS